MKQKVWIYNQPVIKDHIGQILQPPIENMKVHILAEISSWVVLKEVGSDPGTPPFISSPIYLRDQE